ncbi:protein kinase [Streptomyces sp. NPDC018031]|uniref:protein kinase domain-containing protein n=1 Tax=Streptomyces sp. NPDC018031 TaxID=3365033 RepID=UPI0037A0DF1C
MTHGIGPGVRLAQGRFLIGELLGRGGMAAVYRAHDDALGRTVAIKTMTTVPGGDPAGRERFRREARAAAALSHAHVVAVYDVLEEDVAGVRVPYLVMEYVQGRPLSHYVPPGPGGLPLAEALRFVSEILDALAASHAAGLVHRDVKPANVMVTEAGSVKVMDFGIARALDAQVTALTGTGFIVGTPHYMAPEQFTAGGAIDPRCDLYAVGVILFQLLTGRVPFDAESGFQIGYQHVTAEPPALSVLGVQVPGEVQALLTRALAKSPQDRFPDARSMRAQILQVAGRDAAAAGTPDGGYVATALDRAPAGGPRPPASAGPGSGADIPHDAPPSPLAGLPTRPQLVPVVPSYAPDQHPMPIAPPPTAPGEVTRRLKRGLGHPIMWLLALTPLVAYGMVLGKFDDLLTASNLPPAVVASLRADIPGWAVDDWWRTPMYVVLLCALAPLLYFRARLSASGAPAVRAWTVAAGCYWLAVCAAWGLHFAQFTVLDDAIEPVVHQYTGLHSAVRVMGILPDSAMLPVTIACACATPVVLFRTALRIRRAWRAAPLGHLPPDQLAAARS